MYKKTIKYTDFNGKEKEGTFYFNLTRPELMEMKESPLYQMQKIVDKIKTMEDPDTELSYEEKDTMRETLGEILRNLVIQSYGVKSSDGEKFSKRIGNRRYGAGEEFVETMAYDSLYMEMMDISNLVKFVRAIVPAESRSAFEESLKNTPEIVDVLEESNDNVVSIVPAEE